MKWSEFEHVLLPVGDKMWVRVVTQNRTVRVTDVSEKDQNNTITLSDNGFMWVWALTALISSRHKICNFNWSTRGPVMTVRLIWEQLSSRRPILWTEKSPQLGELARHSVRQWNPERCTALRRRRTRVFSPRPRSHFTRLHGQKRVRHVPRTPVSPLRAVLYRHSR